MIKFAIVLAVLFAASAAEAKILDTDVTLERLCRNKTVEVNKISQVEILITNLNAIECPDVTRSGLIDLEPLVGSGLDDVCSAEKIEQIRGYYAKYIAHNGAAAGDKMIPESLRKFFFGFGLRVSSACKRALLEHLIENGRSQIPEEDMEVVSHYLNDDKFAVRALIGVGDYETALSLAEVGGGLVSGNKAEVSKLSLQTVYADHIRLMQRVCDHSLRSIYGPTMTKVASLSSIGFNYKKDEDLKALADSEELRFWYKIISACEMLSTIQVVNFGESDKADGNDKRTIIILTDEEARAISIGQIETESAVEPPINAIQPTRKQLLGDQVIGAQDEALMKSINKLNARRRRDKILRKASKLLKWTKVTESVQVLSSAHKMARRFPKRTKEDQQILKEISAELEAYLRASEVDYNPDDSVPRGTVRHYSTMAHHITRRKIIWALVVLVAICFVLAVVFH